MKLSLSKPETKRHTGMVHSVCWNPLNNELLSIGDDKQLYSWHMSNESSFDDQNENIYTAKKLLNVSHHCISMKWCPDKSFMAAAFADGSMRIISFDKSSNCLRIDKTIENAHRGAVTCLEWNSEGSALITGGEDGVIKQWSRSGNLRAKLLQATTSIHSLCWAHNNQSIVYASDKYVTIEPIHGKRKKSSKWVAHSGIVLCLDWNASNHLLITGGEDCHYRIWDEFGRLVYCSNVFNYPINALLWAPNGTYFSVASYNLCLLCDSKGWIYDSVSANALCMDWSEDSTHLGIGYGNGEVIIGQVTDQSILYRNWFVTANHKNEIIIQNIFNSDFESVYQTLDFENNESVIKFAINNEYLIVITTRQCYIYQIESVINSPQTMPLTQGNIVYAILLTQSFFVCVNSIDGIQIIGFDGKLISQISKSESIQPKLLNTHSICVTNDTLAIVNQSNTSVIDIFDPYTCQPLSDSIKHSNNITQIALSLLSNIRKIAFIDCNKDLFIAKIHSHKSNLFKLQTIVDSIAWHPKCDILFALTNKQLLVWYYPSIVWCDTDLLKHSLCTIDIPNGTNNGQIISIENTLITIRSQNGNEEILSFSSLPLVMSAMISEGKWDKALRLCNICNHKSLWGSLTGLAIDNEQIEIAIQGLTALDESDKVLFFKSVHSLPLQIHRNAEILLYRKNIKSAENILLQNDLIYRAIELNLRLFKFRRALQIAMDYNTHIETVMAFRGKYLQNLKKSESIDLFIKYQKNNDINIDWEAIKEKYRQEIDREYDMAGVMRMSNNTQCNYLSFLESGDNATIKCRKSGRKELESLLGIHSITNINTNANNSFHSTNNNSFVFDNDENDTIDID